MLAVQNVNFNRLFTKIETSPAEGLKGKAYLYSLRTDSLELDTIYFNIAQEVGKLAFRSGVIAGNKPFQEAFDVSLNGEIEADGANMFIEYLNGKKECGARMGFVAKLQKDGISLHVSPDDPILVYRQFQVNPQNYIYLKMKDVLRPIWVSTINSIRVSNFILRQTPLPSKTSLWL